MSETPWTPGPWEEGSYYDGKRRTIYVVDAMPADGSIGPEIAGLIHTEANARLIAAAPEMAALLESLVRCLNHPSGECDYAGIDDVGEKAIDLLERTKDA